MVIYIDLIFLNDNETLCVIHNNENRLYSLLVLNRQHSANENGIRAMIEVENIELNIIECHNNINIDIRILDNENISDEDFLEFERNNEFIDDIPISWYNDNHLEDTEDWYSD